MDEYQKNICSNWRVIIEKSCTGKSTENMFFFQWANQIGSLWGGKKKGRTCEAPTFIFSGWKIIHDYKVPSKYTKFCFGESF
jgi:hypothetical protein